MMIEFSVPGESRKATDDVSTALRCIAKKLRCETSDLTCETADPVHGGRMVWVWHGVFDADKAAVMYVPHLALSVWLRSGKLTS